MRWIDTHCHLDAPEFDADRPAVVARARSAGVGLIVLPAVEVRHFETVRALAHVHGFAYALGIHPLYVDRAGPDDLCRLQQALADWHDDPRLVAVGEIGLDHFVPGIDRENQSRHYLAQLRLAREAGLPVILHVRRSADALLAGLRRLPVAGGIAHAFNGSEQQARVFVDLGLRLGFGGAMTFERALQIRRLAQQMPETALVLETDAPDIPPQWLYRPAAERAAGASQGNAGPPQGSLTPSGGGRRMSSAWGRSSRNEPAELPRIAETLAALRGWTLAETAERTALNAHAALPRLAGA